MLEAITPVNPEWIHEHLIQSPLEGAERINRAWQGIDTHSLNRTPLSIKERVISLIVGIALMLPFVNTIIWIAWQTFGKPERLSDPFSPEIEPTRPPPLLPLVPQPQPPAPANGKSVV